MDSPLHAACMRGDVSSVQSLLSGPHTSNDPDTVLGWAPLHFAAKYGRNEIVALLLATCAFWQPAQHTPTTPDFAPAIINPLSNEA